MAQFRFTADYDHYWTHTRAVSHYPAGTVMTVKREVGRAAALKGKGHWIKNGRRPNA